MNLSSFPRVRDPKTLACVFALVLTIFTANPRGAFCAPAASGDALPTAAQSEPRIPQKPEEMMPPPKVTRKQRQEILKQRFEEMRRDAHELASLADSLRDDLDKSSENILSLGIVEKAAMVEKLAKQIKNAAKGD